MRNYLLLMKIVVRWQDIFPCLIRYIHCWELSNSSLTVRNPGVWNLTSSVNMPPIWGLELDDLKSLSKPNHSVLPLYILANRLHYEKWGMGSSCFSEEICPNKIMPSISNIEHSSPSSVYLDLILKHVSETCIAKIKCQPAFIQNTCGFSIDLSFKTNQNKFRKKKRRETKLYFSFLIFVFIRKTTLQSGKHSLYMHLSHQKKLSHVPILNVKLH